MNYEILGKSITVKGNEGQERLMEKLSSRWAGVQRGYLRRAHGSTVPPSRGVSKRLPESWVDACGQRKSALSPQWLHTFLTSSSVWHEILVLESVFKLQETPHDPRRQGMLEKWATLCVAQSQGCRTHQRTLRVGRQDTKVAVVIFISLFLREFSWVSKAEQEHTNVHFQPRLAGWLEMIKP